jgi:large subunit ribosomal protein L6
MPTEQLELEIPSGINISYKDNKIIVEGSNGKIIKDISKIPVDIKIEENIVKIIPLNGRRRSIAIANTVRSLLKNMIHGVTKGYRYKLKITHSHFPITIKVKDKSVLIENFIGERSPRVAKIEGNSKVTIDGEDIIVEGIDLEEVSQTAANIENATRIKGKDLRVFLDGIYIYAKERNI